MLSCDGALSQVEHATLFEYLLRTSMDVKSLIIKELQHLCPVSGSGPCSDLISHTSLLSDTADL